MLYFHFGDFSSQYNMSFVLHKHRIKLMLTVSSRSNSSNQAPMYLWCPAIQAGTGNYLTVRPITTVCQCFDADLEIQASALPWSFSVVPRTSNMVCLYPSSCACIFLVYVLLSGCTFAFVHEMSYSISG